MDESPHQKGNHKTPKSLRGLGLFLCLSSMFLVYPHLADSNSSRLLLDTLFTLTVAFSLVKHSQLNGIVRILFLTSGLMATSATWLSVIFAPINELVPACYSVFFFITILFHAHELFANSEVDAGTLLGAGSTYIFIGLFFASVNSLLMRIDPQAMQLSDDGTPEFYQLIYFSFVTLTTVGYGDVLPLSNSARMLAVYEAIIGQIFVAVIVGLLVGRYLGRSKT